MRGGLLKLWNRYSSGRVLHQDDSWNWACVVPGYDPKKDYSDCTLVPRVPGFRHHLGTQHVQRSTCSKASKSLPVGGQAARESGIPNLYSRPLPPTPETETWVRSDRACPGAVCFVWGLEFGVQDLGFRVSGLGFRVSEFGFQV